MPNLPKDLPQRLRAAGLTVVEIDDWETRGRPTSTGGFDPVGVLNHHTGAYDGHGDPEQDLAYAKWMFLTGRSDLPAPLCQLALSVEGVVYVGAAGRANHAGTARESGSVAAGDGNSLYVGIEWMLSGAQKIPERMLRAAASLNAVLLQVLGSSVQTVSCHYQTSTTGKWDIGDPDGIEFKGHRVLNVGAFRQRVQRELDRLRPEKPGHWKQIKIQHTSLQWSDTKAQMAEDVQEIFSRGADMLSGTEAGAGNELGNLLKLAAVRHDYRLQLERSVWVAVKDELIVPGNRVRKGYVPVLDSQDGSGRHTDRGVAWMQYKHVDFGTVTFGCAHYLTNGRRPGTPNYELNRRMANAIGKWARENGKGRDIVFYAGDQNIVDRYEDTFFGNPLTSAWDELERYQNTGHGNIDVVASYDRDARVRVRSCRALDDKKLPLHTDHFLVEAVYDVEVDR